MGSACAVNTRRRPDDVAALLVSPRRREANFQHPPDDGKNRKSPQQQQHHSRTFGSFVFGLSFLTERFFSVPTKQLQQHPICQHVEYEEYSLCIHVSGTTIVVLLKKTFRLHFLSGSLNKKITSSDFLISSGKKKKKKKKS